MPANPLHSSLSNEHYSPASIVEPARAVLGSIDLDPASCAFADRLVQAEIFMSQNYNGLHRPWDLDRRASRVFLNPPGGKYDKHGNPITKGPGRSSAAVWWTKLVEEYRADRVHSAIFVCFSLNVFRTAQSECDVAPYEFPFVVCGERVRYDTQGPNGERIPGKSPQQDSAIVYIPPKGWRKPGPELEAFREHFSPLGAVRL